MDTHFEKLNDLQAKHVGLLKENLQLKSTVDDLPRILATINSKHEKEVEQIQIAADKVIRKLTQSNSNLQQQL